MASGQPRVIRLPRHPDLDPSEIQKVILDVSTNILILVTSVRLVLFNLSTFSFHSIIALDRIISEVVAHCCDSATTTTKSDVADLFGSLFQSSLLFSLGLYPTSYPQSLESRTLQGGVSSSSPTNCVNASSSSLRGSINRSCAFGLPIPLVPGLWSVEPMLRRTSTGIVLGHMCLGQSEVPIPRPGIQQLKQQPNQKAQHSDMDFCPDVECKNSEHFVSISSPYDCSEFVPQSTVQTTSPNSMLSVVLLPLIALLKLLSNPHFRQCRLQDAKRHPTHPTDYNNSAAQLSSVDSHRDSANTSSISPTEPLIPTSSTSIQKPSPSILKPTRHEYGPALLGNSPLDLLGIFLPRVLLEPLITSLPLDATSPLLKVLFDAYSCRLPMLIGIVGASMSLSIPLPPSLLCLTPDLPSSPRSLNTRAKSSFCSLSPIRLDHTRTDFDNSDTVDEHDNIIRSQIARPQHSYRHPSQLDSAHQDLHVSSKSLVNLSLACRERAVDYEASLVRECSKRPLDIVQAFNRYRNEQLPHAFSSTESGRDPFSAALGVQTSRKHHRVWSSDRLTVDLSPQRRLTNSDRDGGLRRRDGATVCRSFSRKSLQCVGIDE